MDKRNGGSPIPDDYKKYRSHYPNSNKSEKLPTLHRYSLVILVLLFCSYLISSSAVMEVSFLDFSGNVVYRGKQGVSLVCPIRWDAKSIDEIMNDAEELSAPITFFATNEWISQNPEKVKHMTENHAIGLLGTAANKDEFFQETEEFRGYGLPLAYYMPLDDSNANRIARAAQEDGVSVVLSSFDVLSRSSSSKDAVDRIGNSAFEGAIVRFEPTEIMKKALPEAIENLKRDGYEIKLIPDLVGSYIV